MTKTIKLLLLAIMLATTAGKAPAQEIAGLSPFFAFDSRLAEGITGLSPYFAFETRLASGVSGLSPLFGFDTRMAGGVTGLSNFFAYDTRLAGGITGVSPLFAFESRMAGGISGLSPLFAFESRMAGGISGLSPLFAFDNRLGMPIAGLSSFYFFDVKPPQVSLHFPNGGEVYPNTQPVLASWTVTDDNLKLVFPVNISLWVMPDSIGYALEPFLMNTGYASVNLPDIYTDKAKIRIGAIDNMGNYGVDWSDGYIIIANRPTVITFQPSDISEVTAIAGGEVVDNGGLDVSARGLAYKAMGSGNIWTEIPFGSGLGSYSAMIEGLEPGTTYQIKAYASSPAGTGYGEMYSFTTVEKYECPPQLLYGGQLYQTITAGEQCWMKQSLSVGQMINSSSQQTNNSIVEKYCQNNLESNCNTYGGLYSWHEMMQYSNQAGAQGICPGNWHIPDDEEWKTLEGTADSQFDPDSPVWDGTNWRGFDAGKNLKSVVGWETNSGTDLIGFKALPGGSHGSGSFYHFGSYAFFWTSTESGTSQAWHRSIFHQYNDVYRMAFNKTNAYSVRCLKNSGEFAAPPVVVTLPANTTSLDSALAGGNVTGDGGAIIFERGIYWGYQPNPVATGEKLGMGNGTGEFSIEIGPLQAGATCYVKAFARNYAGTGYGQEVSFYVNPYLVDTINVLRGGPTTTNPLAIPVQITGVNATPYSTNLNSWTGGWQAPQAVYDQGAFVNDPDYWSNIQGQSNTGSTWNNPQPGTGYGILVVDMNEIRHVLNISVFQMFADGKTTHIAFAGHPETGAAPPGASHGSWFEILPKSPVGAGSNFNTYIANPKKLVVDASTRYVKIMVWNDGSLGSAGYIELKGVKMFAEKFVLMLPVVSTAYPSDITVNSAVVGGNVTSDGGAEVTSRGVFWGTVNDPQISGTQFPVGNGTGEFSVVINGLHEGKTYYVVAYATNFKGTALGEVKQFTTQVTQIIPLNAGWSGISSYIIPADPTLNVIFSNVLNDVTIMQNFDGVFWPEEGINTLGNWNSLTGYQVKMVTNQQVLFTGELQSDPSVMFDAGWNYLPVPVACENAVTGLFDPVMYNFQILKEVAGWKVFWPEYGINTIGLVQPGKAYFALFNEMTELQFPACGLKNSINQPILPKPVSPICWPSPSPTPQSHLVMISREFISALKIAAGDYIGGFTSSGRCAGVVEISNPYENHCLTLFADDPLTLEQDGFFAEEPISLKLFNALEKTETAIDAVFDPSFPNQGFFAIHGISALKTGQLAIGSLVGDSELEFNIFPNPAREEITISWPSKNQEQWQLSIYSAYGQLVKDLKSISSFSGNQHFTLDISGLDSGTYSVSLITGNRTGYQTIIIIH